MIGPTPAPVEQRFPRPGSRRPVRGTPAGWDRLTPKGSKSKAQKYRHVSGWKVVHCGHPTAFWPYALIDPAFPDAITMSWNGQGFPDLAEAIEAVEGLVSGTAYATDSRCARGVRRVLAAS